MRAKSFSGPFSVETYEERQQLVLVRNENYPVPPLLQRIEYRLVDDPQTLFLMYQNDEVDLTLLGSADADNVKNKDETFRAELAEQPIWWLDNLYMRSQLAPFEDPLVRSAFAKAIDKATLLEVVERNLYQNMDGIYHPELDIYEETTPVLTFDPEGAAADIAASSYGSIDALPPLAFYLSAEEATGTENTRAAAMQEMWRQNLGVEVELRVVPTFEELLSSDVQLLIGSEGMQYPDASNAVGYLLCDSGANWAQFCNEDFEALVDEAAATQDLDLSKANYQAGQQIVLDSAALLPMWRRANYFLVKPRVGNFVTTAMYTFPSFSTDLYIASE
jgi:ABC-type transport system substrate-binding protein